ncbi:phosphopyruvate hydratase [Candidatus Micrarchaeota archaeon]|nr:phosphopyruvate hydratase [Candidatus Micrarchaeota archaeon]
MVLVKSLKAREILDSRGEPTVEVELCAENGVFFAMVPSGASAGSHEALEMRDGEKRFGGKGVLKAVKNVNEVIAKKIVGRDAGRQKEIDEAMLELDGTENKGRLGANAVLPVSIACLKAAAAAKGKKVFEYVGELAGVNACVLPVPQLNVMNGGKHAGQENDVQEHMLMPVGAKNYAEGLRMACETYQALKKILKKKFGARGTLIGDEGGFVPPVANVEGRLELMAQAAREAGWEKEVVFALDCASTEFYKDGVYTIGDKRFSSGELADYYSQLVARFPVVSIEDGMSEDDWEGWQELTRKIGGKTQVVGDDLLVTNAERIKKAVELKAVNSALIKVNQIGSVSETLDAIVEARKSKWSVVVSHRSGETEDAFIADLVVGVNGGQSKFGAPARSDRNAKYNELLRIEEALGAKAKYLGRKFRG